MQTLMQNALNLFHLEKSHYGVRFCIFCHLNLNLSDGCGGGGGGGGGASLCSVCMLIMVCSRACA